MDTAGKAVLLSGATVLISLSAVMLVPVTVVPLDGRRHHARGRLRARRDADPAARWCSSSSTTGSTSSRCRGCTPASTAPPKFAAWGERLWRRPLVCGLASLVVLLALAAPVLGLKTAMPSIKVLPERRLRPGRLRPGPGRRSAPAHPARSRSSSTRPRPQAAAAVLADGRRASPAPCPPQPAADGSRPTR